MSKPPRPLHSPTMPPATARTFLVTSATWERRPLFRSERMARPPRRVLYAYREPASFRLHEFVLIPLSDRIVTATARETVGLLGVQLCGTMVPLGPARGARVRSAGGFRKQDRVNDCHRAFVEQVAACASATLEPAVEAVLTFLQHWEAAGGRIPEDFDPSAVLTFRVDDVLPIDLPSVKRHWVSVASPAPEALQTARSEGQAMMQCLI